MRRLLSCSLFIALFSLTACRNEPTSPNRAGDEPVVSAPVDAPDMAVTGRHNFRYVANGGHASFFWSDGTYNMYLSVTHFSSNTGEEFVNLFYNVYQCSEAGCVDIEGGYGNIPNDDFDWNNRSAKLVTNTDAASNPSFYRYAGSGGAIAIAWESRNDYSAQFIGISQEKFGKVQIHTNGKTNYRSASAAGTLLGYAVPGSAEYANGEIGKSVNRSIIISAQ